MGFVAAAAAAEEQRKKTNICRAPEAANILPADWVLLRVCCEPREATSSREADIDSVGRLAAPLLFQFG